MMRPTLVKLPRTNRRPLRHRRLRYVLLFFTVLFGIGAIAFVWSCLPHESVSGDKVEVSIGCIPDNKEGQRTALQTLSSEIRKHPSANIFSVRWRDVWIFPEQPDEWSLYWNCHDGFLEYGCQCGAEGWNPVTERMIDAVAGHRGLLGEFEKYGAEHGP